MAVNPLIPDRDSSFLLYEVHDAEALCEFEYFGDHDRQTFDMTLEAARRLAREQLFPAYKPMDEAPPKLENGELATHPLMKQLFPRIVDLGLVAANRSYEVGGQQLPSIVSTLAITHLMAGNAAAVGFTFLTTGAGHLIETFGDEALRKAFLANMYSGKWTGTMALTEPHAGSSLADITTMARPIADADGQYLIRGSKIFISAGQHDLAENIIHLTLARIAGAPPGIQGVSLFAVPAKRLVDGELVSNDVHATQAIHKIGWRGLPSLVIDYGDNDDCIGWLVGTAGRGLQQMFQMMNEARILVGANGIATASVAYRESLNYALERPQGRKIGQKKDPSSPQVAIVEHSDVRRMLLRQKAIVEGGLSLVLETARFQDVSEHGDEAHQSDAKALLDLLTPITKSFPAEFGFESNVLALQIHGGYGYSSEYLPESWLRDQKLNSIHEGTTGIQGLDLLGRKALRDNGSALRKLSALVAADRAAAPDALRAHAQALGQAFDQLAATTMAVGARGAHGDIEGMLRHSTDYLLAASAIVVAWQWLKMAGAAHAGLDGASERDEAFYRGKLAAADYWFGTELPLAVTRLAIVTAGEDSFSRCLPSWF